MKEIQDLLFARKDKTGRAIWMRVGKFMDKGDGKRSIKIDAIPVGFDGWLVVGTDKGQIDTTDEVPFS
jgi:hypothetical protein